MHLIRLTNWQSPQVLDNKKISYYSCIKELNIDDNKLYFLNNKDYGNENDNSSVVYTKFNNYKFLFMVMLE